MMNSPERKESPAEAITRLLTLMARLRDPEKGCAWDLKQSLRSLTAHTLEEVYEVIDAIDRNDPAQLQDELGDLLFQVVFYARIAEEEGHFDFAGVAESISAKLLRRHPHIFPDGTLESFGQKSEITAEQVAINWEQIKNREREEKSEETATQSVLDDVPAAFPALERAKKLQKRAASIGFDWPDTVPVLAKLDEEVAELKQAVSNGKADEIHHELGDLIFTCVNLARHLKVEPELALREANLRFESRFRNVEQQAANGDRKLADMDLAELDILWERAKREQDS